MNSICPPCPVCGGRAAFAFRSAYVDVAKCDNPACGHLFALSAATDDGVQTHTDPEAESSLYMRRNARLVAYWKRRGFLPTGISVLDVGAGAGHVAAEITRAVPDARVTCIEADPPSCRNLRARGFTSHESLETCTDKFDAILLVEVIEHIATPIEFLRVCRDRMAEGAKIFLSTPCGETSHGNRRTNAYDTQEHVQFFTETSLALACRAAGLRPLGYEAVSDLYPRRTGLPGVIDEIKYQLLPVRDALRGRAHLITFLERGD